MTTKTQIALAKAPDLKARIMRLLDSSKECLRLGMLGEARSYLARAKRYMAMAASTIPMAIKFSPLISYASYIGATKLIRVKLLDGSALVVRTAKEFKLLLSMPV